MLSEKFVCVNSRNNINGDVRSLVLEATVDIYVGIDTPAGMTETLKRVKFVPL